MERRLRRRVCVDRIGSGKAPLEGSARRDLPLAGQQQGRFDGSLRPNFGRCRPNAGIFDQAGDEFDRIGVGVLTRGGLLSIAFGWPEIGPKCHLRSGNRSGGYLLHVFGLSLCAYPRGRASSLTYVQPLFCLHRRPPRFKINQFGPALGQIRAYTGRVLTGIVQTRVALEGKVRRGLA